MDFRTQRYFMTVAQELSFTRAARKLNMSQPPLSNTIKDLEEELGVQLFIRGKRHLQLTGAGELLLERTAELFDLADKAKNDVRSLGDKRTGKLYIASADGRAAHLAASWIAGFRESHPAVTYDLWSGSSEEAMSRLKRGLADLAIVSVPYDEEHFTGITVGKEPWVAIIPESHPLAKKKGKTVRISDLRRERLAVPLRKTRAESIERWLSGAGEQIDTVCTLSGYEDALALAEHGAGISIYPMTSAYPPPGVCVKTITEPARYIEYALVRPKGKTGEGLAADFAGYVSETLRKKDGSAESAFAVPSGAEILL